MHMEIEKLTGGKSIEIQKPDSPLPEHLDSEGRLGYPGSLFGDADLRDLVGLVSQLAHRVPSVEWLRIIFKTYNEIMYLLLIPLMLRASAEEVKQIKEENPNFYRLRIRNGGIQVTGLARLFEDGDVPLREDQWHVCKAKVIQDDVEGYAVALNWTGATLEPRDILKERRMRSEAAKRRRERKKQMGNGHVGD